MTLAWTDPPGFVGGGEGKRALVNDLDLRVIVWREGEDPNTVVFGNMQNIPDRRNNVEKVSVSVKSGDSVRVVVSAAGPITHTTQLYSLVWTKHLLATGGYRKCNHACTNWDPEFECVTSAGEYGVRACQYSSYQECHAVKTETGREICPVGYSRDDTGICKCYTNIPCADEGAPNHFALCGANGNLSTCVKLGSIFSAVADIHYRHVSIQQQSRVVDIMEVWMWILCILIIC